LTTDTVATRAAYDSGRPADDSDRISIAPALDTTAAVTILALPRPCESLPAPMGTGIIGQANY
jgi:hypothetical protein